MKNKSVGAATVEKHTGFTVCRRASTHRWLYGTVSFRRTIQSGLPRQYASIRLTNTIPVAILKSFPLALAPPVLCFVSSSTKKHGFPFPGVCILMPHCIHSSALKLFSPHTLL